LKLSGAVTYVEWQALSALIHLPHWQVQLSDVSASNQMLPSNENKKFRALEIAYSSSDRSIIWLNNSSQFLCVCVWVSEWVSESLSVTITKAEFWNYTYDMNVFYFRDIVRRIKLLNFTEKISVPKQWAYLQRNF